MGNRINIEHEIALITKIHEYLLEKLNDYKNKGIITSGQFDKIADIENNSHQEAIKDKQSYIWGG